MIFIDNKYTKWYYAIIDHALKRENSGYTEKHHIIPLSLSGNNKKSNIVILTPREHFVCHLLLTRMTTGNGIYKMKYALSMIVNVNNIGGGRYTPTGRTYSMAKRLQKEAITDYWTADRRKNHAELVKKNQKPRTPAGNESMIQYQKTKTWSEKAIQSRILTCAKAAANRKGTNWSPEHRQHRFSSYVIKNREIIDAVLLCTDMNTRQISIKLGISWDKVNGILNKRDAIIAEINII